MKRFLSLCIVLCLLLSSAVSIAAESTDDLQVYSETILELPEGYQAIANMAVAPDGSIVAAAKGPEGWVLLTWQDRLGSPSILPLTFEGGDISGIDIAPDGQVMATLTDMTGFDQLFTTDNAQSTPQGGGQIEQTAQASQSAMGSRQEQNMQGAFGGFSMVTTVIWFAEDGTVAKSLEIQGMSQQIKALTGRRIAVSGMQSGASIYNEDGVEEVQIGVSNVQNIAATDTVLYLVAWDALYCVDAQSGEQLKSIPLQTGYTLQPYVTQDGTLYLCSNEGVFTVAPGTDQLVKILDPVGTLLGDPSNSVTSFGVLDDGTIVILVGAGTAGLVNLGGRAGTFANRIGGAGDETSQSATLAVYTPIDGATIGNRTEFTITALRNSNRLRKAVSDFQRRYPELKVTLQVQLEDNDDSPIEDHIRTLNTDLLAGKGGDVLILDDLPIDKYAARGILADLSGILPELGILPGISSGETNKDGKIYSLPAQFSFYTLWGRATNIQQVATLEDMVFANLAADQVPMASRTPEELLRLFYPSSEASFRDEQGQLHFNTPAFEAFLEALYELYTTQGELPELQMQIPNARQMGRGGMNVEEMLAVYNGAVAFYPIEVNGLLQMTTAYSLAGGTEGGFITLPAMDGQCVAYTPSVRVGVNAQSQHLDLAMEFLRIMFSPDVQEVDQMSGLPTTTASLDKLFADSLERSEGGARAMFMIPGGVSLEIVQPDAQAWKALQDLCLQVNTPATIDETLMGFIISETANFFDGYATAVEAGEIVEQRAWFYLNE